MPDPTPLAELPNPNTLWGTLIIEELYRSGVRHVVMAPGSRSTPLVVALARHPHLTRHIAIDERAGGFLALGLARGSGRPVAIVTTSGTAVANLLPAMVEASADHIPLVAITADRPPELQDVGANQTIPQPDIFGTFVRWRTELPCPDDSVPARLALTSVDRVLARAVEPDPGPVHLNCPFREPLAPTEIEWDRRCLQGLDGWMDGDGPFTWTPEPTAATDDGLGPIVSLVAEASRGLVVAGTVRETADAAAIARLAEVLGWPLATDIRSGLRLGHAGDHHLPHLELALSPEPDWRPDVVVQFGGRLVSKRLGEWLDGVGPRHRVLVDPVPATFDPDHRVSARVVAHATEVMEAVERAGVGASGSGADLRALRERDRAVARVLEGALGLDGPMSEPFVARWVSGHLHPDHGLFVASSLPIRDLNAYAVTTGPAVAVAANRGASGIDGTVATAVGFAAGLGRPVTLLIGDLALLHDVGSLALARDAIPPVTIVLIDNGGGGIFEFLPIAAHPSVFTPWFDTPQDIDLTGIAAAFDLPCTPVEDPASFIAAYEAATGSGRSALIRVRSDRKANAAFHRDLGQRIATAIGGAPS